MQDPGPSHPRGESPSGGHHRLVVSPPKGTRPQTPTPPAAPTTSPSASTVTSATASSTAAGASRTPLTSIDVDITQHFDAFRRELHDKNVRIEKYKEVTGRVQEEMQKLQFVLRKKDAEMAELALQLAEKQRENDGMMETIHEANKALRREKEHVQRLRELVSMEKEVSKSALDEKLIQSEQRSEELDLVLRSKLAALRRVEEERDRLKPLEDANAVLEKRVNVLQSKVWDLEGELHSREKESARMEEELAELKMRAQKFIGSDKERLEEENRRISQEIAHWKNQHFVLEQEVASQQRELDTLRREVDLRETLVNEVTRKAQSKKHKEKDMGARLANMEKALNEALRQGRVEKQRLVHQLENQGQEVHHRENTLQKIIEKQKKELHHLRRLGRSILQQRSQLEQFLLESLEIVRLKAEEEREQSSNVGWRPKGVMGLTRLVEPPRHRSSLSPSKKRVPSSTLWRSEDPSLTGNAALDGGGVSLAPPVDGESVQEKDKDLFGTLSWAEREQVLRLLFSKLTRKGALPGAPVGSGAGHGSSSGRSSERRAVSPEEPRMLPRSQRAHGTSSRVVVSPTERDLEPRSRGGNASGGAPPKFRNVIEAHQASRQALTQDWKSSPLSELSLQGPLAAGVPLFSAVQPATRSTRRKTSTSMPPIRASVARRNGSADQGGLEGDCTFLTTSSPA